MRETGLGSWLARSLQGPPYLCTLTNRQMSLTMPVSSSYFDAMGVDLERSRRLVDAAMSEDPQAGLTAVVALRQLVEVLEELQVANARQHGWSWRDIARRLGVTKQAVHYKHGLRSRKEEP